MKKGYNWRFFRTARLVQVQLETADDVAHLAELDPKLWTVLAAPADGLRFDARTFALMDSDGDGRVRLPEVLAAVDWLKARGVDLGDLFKEDRSVDEAALADVTARQADLAAAAPSEADLAALKAWEEAPARDAAILPLGDKTAAANDALAAVEAVVDGFFAVPDDLPLVLEEADKALPLSGNLNPKWLDALTAFAATVAAPVLGGEKTEITRLDWNRVKAAFAPYRAWLAAKPVMAADAKAKLEAEERTLRYKLHLGEFLRNYVNQANLYDPAKSAIYRTGTLFIDGRACSLVFHVADEAAHAALAEKSKCCLLYAKLSRKGSGESRTVCAVVTAGSTGMLYAGRNGVFVDRDGRDWDATVTKVVEAQVSLREAFWAPWRKIGEGVAGMVKKFFGDKQAKAVDSVQKGTESTQAGGAALASSVAAIGIGIGMVGAAAASLVTAIQGLRPWWMFFVALAAVVLVVSLPSVVLAWFKLRQRDLGAILNAGGWAVNRPLFFSMRLARLFTREARMPAGAYAARDPYAGHGLLWTFAVLLVLAAAAAAAVYVRAHAA